MTDKPIMPEEEDDALAAEYVLGLVTQEQRAHCELRVLGDPAFSASVADWRSRLAPLDDYYPAVQPPTSLRVRLEKQLFGSVERHGLWSSAGFWRGLTALALAASVAIALVPGEKGPPDQMLATVANADRSLHLVAVYDRETAVLRLNHVAGEPTQGRDLELWVIAGDNPPASLGLVTATGRTELNVAEALRPHFGGDYALAISDEPLGGSPTGAPTGEVLAVGPAVSI
jgi:anti-sigma-K factor RskA